MNASDCQAMIRAYLDDEPGEWVKMDIESHIAAAPMGVMRSPAGGIAFSG